MKAQLSLLASGLMMGLMTSGAYAVAMGPDYCGADGTVTSTYNATQGNGPVDLQAVTLNTSDVFFNTSTNIANDCYGVVEGNDRSDLGGLTLWGGDWIFLLKDEGDETAQLTIFDEDGNNGRLFDFTLGADINAETGDWELTISPQKDLPIQMDFLVVLKGAPAWAAYFFDDELITDKDNDGEFIMRIKNNGGNTPELSHLSFYVRDYFYPGDEEPPVLVPEPGMLFLMGAGLLGLGMSRRRKSA